MKIEKLELINYRNIKNAYLEPCDGINIIYGENAQGKTNLLEAIWLLSGFKSFRGASEREIISFGEKFSKINSRFFSGERSQTSEIILNPARKAKLNGVELSSPAELIGNFRCIVFSPSYLSLVKGSPGERRKFLDIALCQISPVYSRLLRNYNKILLQRNSFLKELKFHSDIYDYMDVWNYQLSQVGCEILKKRVKYTELLSSYCEDIYSGLSGNRESLSVKYKIKCPNGSMIDGVDLTSEQITQMLKESEKNDIYSCTTSIGIHRDNIEILIDGKSAKNYGSQGQQRSAALSLKLAEAEILDRQYNEKPVILLDDVMSELDVNRQDYILNHINNRQVFITCCEPSNVLRMCKGKTFNMEKGCLI